MVFELISCFLLRWRSSDFFYIECYDWQISTTWQPAVAVIDHSLRVIRQKVSFDVMCLTHTSKLTDATRLPHW